MPAPSDSTIAAILKAIKDHDKLVDKNSMTQWGAIKRVVVAKDVVVAVAFFLSMIGGAFLIFQDLRDKPSLPQVHEAIEHRVKPVDELTKANAESIEQVKEDVGSVKEKIERIESVQDYQLEQSSWEGEVLEHLAGSKGPRRPDGLKAKERELIKR
jgi:hypothetical protein